MNKSLKDALHGIADIVVDELRDVILHGDLDERLSLKVREGISDNMTVDEIEEANEEIVDVRSEFVDDMRDVINKKLNSVVSDLSSDVFDTFIHELKASVPSEKKRLSGQSVQLIKDPKLISKIKSDLSAEGYDVDSIECAEDPKNAGVYAVRAKVDSDSKELFDTDTLDFLYDTNDDVIEEVEFTSWPPTFGSNTKGLRVSTF